MTDDTQDQRLTDAEHNEHGTLAGRVNFDRWVYTEDAVEAILAARSVRDDSTPPQHEGWTVGGRPLDVIQGRLVEPGRTVCVHGVGLTSGLWCGGCRDALTADDPTRQAGGA